MANSEIAGSALYAEWIYSGGTIVLDTDSRSFTYTPTIDFIDATAGGDTSRKRINSFKDGNVTMSTLAQSDSDGTALLAACAEGTHGTLIWGDMGTATGRPKVTLPAISQGVTRGVPYADVITYDLGFQQNGDRTDGAY